MANADRYTLETPENIEVEYDLAGLGSGFSRCSSTVSWSAPCWWCWRSRR